ncbi:MAG: sulfite exporter TauE/SafE family protein [Anaerotignum sp.]
MTHLICYIVTFFACTIGTICGMGGGIIIKPVLDATGVMSVAAITFLSGCTVISMSCWSVGKNILKKESVLDLKNTTFLALGAATGGLIGKQIYIGVASLFPDQNTAGGVQACLLLAATFATFIYTLNKDKLRSKEVNSPIIGVIIGIFLGILGSFLGIGGGPFNVAVLYYFFSMPTKKATQNSLLIVLFSQLTSTLKTIIFDGIPGIRFSILAGMILLGIIGSETGRQINKKLDNKQATLCLECAMILIMCINIYNIVKFLH